MKFRRLHWGNFVAGLMLLASGFLIGIVFVLVNLSWGGCLH